MIVLILGALNIQNTLLEWKNTVVKQNDNKIIEQIRCHTASTESLERHQLAYVKIVLQYQ